MKPVLSVVMSTYNRQQYIPDVVESVLGQSFTDFEFIIIDDCSNDDSCQVISNYKDSRIRLFHNRENKGCTYNYHVAQNLAKGKYIAHIDDDDISLPTRFEKQIEFLKLNPEISLVGSFIETFGENKRPSWVFYSDSEKLDFVMNFYNPICHSSVMYDNEFVQKKFINYNLACKCAQDYDFYKQFILKGGKLANIDEVLVKYRMHPVRLTDIYDTQQVQINVAENVKNELLSRYLSEEEILYFKKQLYDFPYNAYDKKTVIKGINLLKEKVLSCKKYTEKTIQEVIADIENDVFKF